MNSTLPHDLQRALANAERSRGWNNRPRDVQRFELGACLLYVVPCARWAYRRIERQAQTRRGEQARA